MKEDGKRSDAKKEAAKDASKDAAKKNSRNAKYRLACALEELMESTQLDHVRVSQIVAKAQVSKQTFYHHFSDKYDLMQYCLVDMFKDQMQLLSSTKPFQHCYAEFLEKCIEKKAFLRNGFLSQDVNSLFRALCYSFSDVYKKRIEAQGILVDESIGFYVDFYAKGCAGCTRHWLELGMNLTVKQLSSLITNSVPASLSHYFH